MFELNLTNEIKMQDAIFTLTNHLKETPLNAIYQAVQAETFYEILETNWAKVAINQWRHDYDNYNFKELNDKQINCNFTTEQNLMIEAVKRVQKATTKETIMMFVLFKLKNFGYHL